MPKKPGPLRCVLCTNRYSEEDVANLSFFVETSTCFVCYNLFAKAPFTGPRGTCFGKQNVISDTGKIVGFGYDPIASTDCSLHCPHRKICPQFATKEIYRERQFLITPFSGPISKAMQTLLRGCSRLRANTMLSVAKTKKTLLRGSYEGKTWTVDRTKKAWKAYFIRKVKTK